MKKHKEDSAAEIVSRGLSTLLAGRKFFAHEASDLHEAFGHIVAAVLRVGNLEKRLAAAEVELKRLKGETKPKLKAVAS